jgi:hypothetical protein
MDAKKTRRPIIRPDETLPGKPDAESCLKEPTPITIAKDAPAKAAGDKPVEPPAHAANAAAKEPFTRKPARESRPMPDLPDMEAADGGGDDHVPDTARDRGDEGYIRMRVRVRGDELRVLDARLVDGPLDQATAFPGGNLYEITLDGRLLHAGALTDLGIQRSFPDPEADEGPRAGHHFAERDRYEFTARVPAGEITPDSVGRVELTLHRVKGEARTDRLGAAPLTDQFAVQVRPVARLRGLPQSIVPEELVRAGKRAARPQ